jgi:outer membrane protein assembly factor BamA
LLFFYCKQLITIIVTLPVRLNGNIFFFAFCLSFSCLVSLQTYSQKGNMAKKHHLLVLPIIARSIETDWSFGLAVSSTFHLKSPRDSLSRTSNIQGLSLYTLQKQFVAVISGSIYFPGEKYILNEQFSYSYFPDKFWGLGKTAPDSNEEPFTYSQFYIYLHPQRLLGNNIFLGLRYEYQKLMNIKYKQGGLFDQQNIAGRTDYHVSGLGLSITYDTRNNAFSPDHGSMLQFYFSHFNNFFGSDYKYTNFVLDLRRFIKIYKQQVLALQAFGFFNSGDVPLRSLAALGGSNIMRGYYSGRYRDKDQAVIQAEYRLPIIGRLGAVGFVGVGNVGKDFSDINFSYLKYSYGGGLRIALNKSERLNLRLDYGIGQKSSGFYFQLGEAF